MSELDRLIRRASKLAAREMAADGGILPFVIARTGDGTLKTISLPKEVGPHAFDHKDATETYFKIRLYSYQATAYVLVAEAWVLTIEADDPEAEAQIAHADVYGLDSHPKRIEVVQYLAESAGGEQRIARQSIIRPSLEPPSLDDDLAFSGSEDRVQGRFLGMLKRSAEEITRYDSILAMWKPHTKR